MKSAKNNFGQVLQGHREFQIVQTDFILNKIDTMYNMGFSEVSFKTVILVQSYCETLSLGKLDSIFF